MHADREVGEPLLEVYRDESVWNVARALQGYRGPRGMVRPYDTISSMVGVRNIYDLAQRLREIMAWADEEARHGNDVFIPADKDVARVMELATTHSPATVAVAILTRAYTYHRQEETGSEG